MYLSKYLYNVSDATNKDKSLKTALNVDKSRRQKSANTEKIRDKPGFFGDQVADFTINWLAARGHDCGFTIKCTKPRSWLCDITSKNFKYILNGN